MTDIRTFWDSVWTGGDWGIDPPALAQCADLETATLISLFTDARAADDDRLPGAPDDRRGWWAGPIGSRLWLLVRELATNETRLRAEDYCREALQWMLDDGVADDITVSAEYRPPPAELGIMDVLVAIYRDEDLIFRRRWGWVWQQARLLASSAPVEAAQGYWDGGATRWDGGLSVWDGRG